MKAIKYAQWNIFLFLLLQSFSGVFAQTNDSSLFLNRAAQYYLGDRDQILMKVNIWGFVRQPGQYVVPRNTNLVSLISFAGGAREGADLSKVRIIREERLANSYNGGKGKNGQNGHSKESPILEINVKNHVKTGDPDIIPTLKAGDTIIIPESGGSKFQKFLGFNSVLSILAATASIALIVERLSR